MPALNGWPSPSTRAGVLPVRTPQALTHAGRRHRVRHATTAGGGHPETAGSPTRRGHLGDGSALAAPISHCTAHAQLVSIRAGSDGGSLVGSPGFIVRCMRNLNRNTYFGLTAPGRASVGKFTTGAKDVELLVLRDQLALLRRQVPVRSSSPPIEWCRLPCRGYCLARVGRSSPSHPQRCFVGIAS